MRTGYVAAILAVMSLFLSSDSSAALDSWIAAVMADNGYGQGFGAKLNLGAMPSGTDQPDVSVVSMESDVRQRLYIDLSQTTRWVVSTIPDDACIWGRNFMSPALPTSYPNSTKSWDLRIAALRDANSDPIRLCLYTASLADPPPSSADGLPIGYRLVMVDNRGIAGAPANGRSWELPIPTAHTSAPYWSLPQADWLPITRLSAPTDSAMISEGYVMRFEQYMQAVPGSAVPEPSTLAGLSFGVAVTAVRLLRRRTK